MRELVLGQIVLDAWDHIALVIEWAGGIGRHDSQTFERDTLYFGYLVVEHKFAAI
jgi:hypothetical protein